jgi:hypothetical protein
MAITIRDSYFDMILNYDNLFNSYKKACKGKGNKIEVIKFKQKYVSELKLLEKQLKYGTYKHSKYRVFYIKYPKERKVEASSFRDRVVHTFIVENFLKPFFEKSFIDTTYACIKNRGTHLAVLETQKGMKHCKRIWNNYYIIKMDIRKYFESIDKEILLRY